MKNKKIFLKNNILENENLNYYDIVTYAALRGVYLNGMEEILITIDTIVYELYENTDIDSIGRKIKEQFKNSIFNLNNLGIINIVKDCGKGRFIINMNNLYFIPNADNPFTTIYNNDIKRILNLIIKDKTDRVKLLNYFIMLMRTVDNRKKVGYKSIEHISNLADISQTTLTSYNKILEDNEIIYTYHHNKVFAAKDGDVNSISSLPNHYGRYNDKDLIVAEALRYEKNQEEEMNRINSKSKRKSK